MGYIIYIKRIINGNSKSSNSKCFLSICTNNTQSCESTTTSAKGMSCHNLRILSENHIQIDSDLLTQRGRYLTIRLVAASKKIICRYSRRSPYELLKSFSNTPFTRFIVVFMADKSSFFQMSEASELIP